MSKSEETIPALFLTAVRVSADKPAMRYREGKEWRTLTYAECERVSRGLAFFLLGRGLGMGDRVAIFMENRPEWLIAYLGIVRAGMVVVPLDCQIRAAEAKTLLNASQSRAVFISSLTAAVAEEAGEQITRIQVGVASANAVSFSDAAGTADPGGTSLAQTRGSDTAAIIYTSGTVAQPKGVVLTHANLCANVRSLSTLGIVTQKDVFLALLPLHHTYPCMVTGLLPLALSATVTFAPTGFNPGDLASLIREANVTILAGVPQLFTLMHSAVRRKMRDIPALLKPFAEPLAVRRVRRQFGVSFRYAVSGGARLDPAVCRELTQWGIRIIEGYGLTETSPVVCLNLPREVRFGSVGKPIPGVEVTIDAPDARGEGEILIKGANVTAGYYQNPGETAAAFRDGWFRSGDLGYIDRDGYLYITGRKKEIIVLGTGKNIYPQELEEYYAQSPYIREICVLEKSDVSFGAQVKVLYAVVVPDEDYFREKKESNMQGRIGSELELLGRALPAYKHIMGFMLSNHPLPRTALNKIQRYRVNELVTARVSAARAAETQAAEAYAAGIDRERADDPVSRAVLEFLTRQLKRPVSLDANLEIDLGIDSLTRVELGLGLESLFKIEIPDEALYTVATVRDVVANVKSLGARPAAGAEGGASVPERSWGDLLRAPLERDLKKRVRLRNGIAGWAMFLTLGMLARVVMRVFWRLRSIGVEHLPREGSFLICPNHASYLDGIAVFAALPVRTALETFFIGYARILELPAFKWGLRFNRLIPLNPDTDLANALKVVSYVLRSGKAACIFPEGQRSVDGTVAPFKKGVGIILKELDIPAVPVYIKNSYAAWPRFRRLPRCVPVTVVFGPPLTSRQLVREPASGKDVYETIAQELRGKVIGLGDA
jgi:long-chain acyl-CoA synthetase